MDINKHCMTTMKNTELDIWKYDA